MFEKIVIANRGEIAVRIIRACRELGVKTVAVYSKADEEALHTQLADEAICIGEAAASDSYLNMERVLSATIVSGADAIHPGFGFLSENSRFADLCAKCNIAFIGPSADVIRSMGDKAEARKTMIQAGVPVVPGTPDPVYTAEEALKEASQIGYPVMIKAASGGGGKGMRIANTPEEFEALFNMAQKESVGAFGDNTMYLEKYISKPRHVEVQIIADKFGNVIQLGERDCSIQRRHQKMVEEAPCLGLSQELRAQIGQTAVRAAAAAGYENAGTIEFLLDEQNHFYFIEMNTRIQVEHPVTEMITGVDLIKEQLRVASGHPLSFTQEDIVLTGHAIECRINAEDPEHNFRPCPGKIKGLHVPGGNGVRIDTAVYQDYVIPANYDSMIMKVIVHGENREEAIRKMQNALGETVIEGICTNLDFQNQIISHEQFIRGELDTHFIQQYFG